MTVDVVPAPVGSPVEGCLRAHLDETAAALSSIAPALPTITAFGADLARVLTGGGRLLVAGNGGSAAHAQHLTSELVGRFRADRPPFSAIALHAEGSALTAILNDYGAEEVFARQVLAHGRVGDLLVLLSTSGRSPNLVAAASCASRAGLRSLAVTGPAPNPLAERCDGCVPIEVPSTAAVQEAHQVVVHLLCVAFEACLEVRS